MAKPPIIETKLQPPRMREGLVPRSHLVERLRDGRSRRLTVVCAPAGYGKTTLLAQWHAEDRGVTPFAWLSLDSGDGDPIRLWNQILFALHGAHAPAGVESSEVLTAGPLAIEPVAIPLLVNELADAPPLVLVLEDWHVVRNPLCDQTMRVFVEQAPENVQVVISSRADPALRLARLRAHDDLVEVRAEQLRLSAGESGELFRSGGIELEPDDVQRLTARTEGWAAGLHLAAIALRDRPDPRAYVETFSGDTRHVLDYLARDVFDAVPPELRDFLLRTSILERLTAPLCDWLLERADSAAVLAEIEHASLFLVSLDETGDAFRYHQLFARMLQRELALVDPGAPTVLHERASAWFESQGEALSAIDHAISARDVRRASDLITALARELWASGQVATLVRWLDRLSWPEANSDPQLALVRATVLGFTGHPPEMLERWIAVAEAGRHDGPLANGLRSLESGAALLRGMFLTRGLSTAEIEAARALELEPDGSSWRRQALAAYGQTLYLLGDGDGARAALEDARRIPDPGAHAPGFALVLSYLALLEADRGRARPAERLARDVIALLEERHLGSSPAAANPELALGAALKLTTDGHGAVDHLERAAALSEPLRPGYWHVHALVRLADGRRHVGDHAGALLAVEAARSELELLPDAGMLEAMLGAVETRLQERRRREGFLGEPLSESELRVLHEMAAGQSLGEIAKHLFLSVNTVKSHRRTIYRKLGVTTREAALERAVELALAQERVTESPG